MQIKTKAIVLKAADYNENDKLLTLLTEELGVVYAYAPGARKMKSRLSSVSSMFCYGEFVLFRNRDRYTIDQAESIMMFMGIRNDLDLLSYASYFCELALGVTTEEEPSGETLRLLLNTIYYLEKKKDPVILKAIFEMRMMTIIGFAPELIACSECGEYERDAFWFNLENGKAVCVECRENPGKTEIPLSGSAFMALRHIVYAPMDKLFGFTIGSLSRIQMAAASEQYLRAHVEKEFPTLDFLNSIKSF